MTKQTVGHTFLSIAETKEMDSGFFQGNGSEVVSRCPSRY